MPSPRNYNKKLTSDLKKSVIRGVTSKQTIKKGLAFANKYPVIVIFILVSIILGGLWFYNSPYNNTQETTNRTIPSKQGSVAGTNNKETQIINGTTLASVLPAFMGSRILKNEKYPNPTKTPGAIYQNITEVDVCDSGYAKRVRNVPVSQKKSVYKSYEISYPQPTGNYELDHFIPLSIGGSNDDKNLWPEPATPVPGFREKDKVEFYLYNQICSGKMSIRDAQESIRTDWYKVYQTISPSSFASDPDGDVSISTDPDGDMDE